MIPPDALTEPGGEYLHARGDFETARRKVLAQLELRACRLEHASSSQVFLLKTRVLVEKGQAACQEYLSATESDGKDRKRGPPELQVCFRSAAA